MKFATLFLLSVLCTATTFIPDDYQLLLSEDFHRENGGKELGELCKV